MKIWRLAFQLTIVVIALTTGFRHMMGWSRTTIEAYCPFGGVEAALALITQKQFTCATGEKNVTLFLALVVLTLLARKSFCSWVCPVGTVSELLLEIGKKLRKAKSGNMKLLAMHPPKKLDTRLRWLRFLMLILILAFTFFTGELIFRGFDPYYILFSFHGHDVMMWSYAVIAVILAGILFIPMAWCRYLCPLGIVLWPFSATGRLGIVRDETTCTGCKACDRACPQSLDVSTVKAVTSGECTLCFECTEICPEKGALNLELKGLILS